MAHAGAERHALGRQFMEGQRFFDETGREISRSEHPAEVARRAGIAQRQRVLGVRAPSGDESWLLASYLPIEQGPRGWSVLCIGAPLRRSVFRPPTEARVESEHPHAASLLAFALEVSGTRLSPDDLAMAMKASVRAIAAAPTSVLLVVREGMEARLSVVTWHLPRQPARTVRSSAESDSRWYRPESVYQPDVQPTEIIGDRVAIEYESDIRSFALIPVTEGDRRVASLAVLSPERHALGGEQLVSLTQLGRLAGPSLTAPLVPSEGGSAIG
jgi:hypothetical protein